ncbi:relaxase/mobilization nuclease domain-containing protein [Ligilactobacillus agilis]|uniref:relaxase/mobilization nuclease domain-containing protein n=1 Tax=Ligilactobacillus agilis TaxID=1601 RepID=UPI0022E2A49B|nr:relaxase/mobilization nuclease domain-containing protein [Ligilactobacillus agilis]
MAILKIISSKSARNTIKYLLDEQAHNTDLTSERALKIDSQNVDLNFNADKNLFTMYVYNQFSAVREIAKKKDKKEQARHLIFSFSDDEFNLTKDNLKEKSEQALTLCSDFLRKKLPDQAQFLTVAQADSDGHKLHVHAVVNSVMLDKKNVDTNLYNTISGRKYRSILDDFQTYMSSNFEKITGKKYEVNFDTSHKELKNSSFERIKERGGYVWKDDLKERIRQAKLYSSDLMSFEKNLALTGVNVTKRRASLGKDATGKKIYREAYTFSFVDQDQKQRKIRDISRTKSGALKGLGEDYTPLSLERSFKTKHRDTDKDKSKVKTVSKPIKKTPERPEGLSNVLLHQQQERIREEQERKEKETRAVELALYGVTKEELAKQKELEQQKQAKINQARKELSKVNRLRKNVKALVTRLENAFKALQQQHSRMQKFREANKPVKFDINNSDFRHYLNLVEPNRVARPFLSKADFERTIEKSEKITKSPQKQQTKSKDEGLEL